MVDLPPDYLQCLVVPPDQLEYLVDLLPDFAKIKETKMSPKIEEAMCRNSAPQTD